ncbi:hypothetical protein PIB30_030856 [Stylosanthes scabra]|uniref:Anaphase-promoting complex subunit 1 N-terminal domain-containing protein n=1 Tax=Stylosanthes scabra TaxID=79078 RepID=A0ABU6VAK4_9FABA|nr:hypothetical protein [Stylosanthes scabra]
MEKISSSIGVRRLTVLGEFKPFGLIAEALDGKVADDAASDKYEYFLFDPEITRGTDVEDSCDEVSSALTNCGDNELFIRGNRIIWSTGARVFKRFTLGSPIVKADSRVVLHCIALDTYGVGFLVCWCRLGHTAEALLCILQIDCLTIYNTSGEVVSPPLSRAVSSIWPLPFGLLLQQEVEGNIPSRAPFSSTSPLLGARDMFSAPSNMQKGEGTAACSHLILMDPLDEQEPIFVEDRGKSNIMKEYDEKTIWTSDRVPLMASYNKGFFH